MRNSRTTDTRRRAMLVGLAYLFVTPASALYDPRPDESLAAVQGEWRGTLTYRDYGSPDRVVTLPTRLFVALGSPNALVLHYVFDDGPSKTVYSYESMRFDFANHRVAWSSGEGARTSTSAITSDQTSDRVRTLVFERTEDGQVKRFTMKLSSRALSLSEDEIGAAGVASFRNRYAFTRPVPGDASSTTDRSPP